MCFTFNSSSYFSSWEIALAQSLKKKSKKNLEKLIHEICQWGLYMVSKSCISPYNSSEYLLKLFSCEFYFFSEIFYTISLSGFVLVLMILVYKHLSIVLTIGRQALRA